MKRGLRPPSGASPPASAELADAEPFELQPLAAEICRRYRLEFPDEEERYASAGQEWCVHDNQHILSWAALAADGYVEFQREIDWLAGVLHARDFPLERLARDLEIAVGVLGERRPAEAPRLEGLLLEAASRIRARGGGTP